MSEKDRDRRLIARYKPYYRELEKGETYKWCSCGRSANQPFCDGSHRETDFRPVRYLARDDGEEVLFCGCKQTSHPPFCDGAHNNLSGSCVEDDPFSSANLAMRDIPSGCDGRSSLDGECFVWSKASSGLERNGTVSYWSVFTAADGALYQSHFYLEALRGTSPVIGLGDRQVVLFARSGKGTLNISGRDFEISSGDGLYVRPGEAFRIVNEDHQPICLSVAVSPTAECLEWPAEMPENFGRQQPERVVGIDSALHDRMGERFFQLLVDDRIGSEILTQFAGEIPFGKTVSHQHLYEESLLIVKGSGCMWTETRRANVASIRVNKAKQKLQNGEAITVISGLQSSDIIDFLGPIGFDAAWTGRRAARHRRGDRSPRFRLR